jgi:hypothetical protein
MAIDVDDPQLWLWRGTHRSRTRPAAASADGGLGRVLRDGSHLRPRPRQRASLPHPFVRDDRAHRLGARARRSICDHVAVDSARSPHVGTRLEARGRIDDATGVQEGGRAGARVLQGREHRPASDYYAHNLDLPSGCYQHKGK